MTVLLERHRGLLDNALESCASRRAWSAFNESPSRRIHGEEAGQQALAEFQALLNRPFELALPGRDGWVGAEVSPFTGQPLGVTYNRVDIDACFAAARQAMPSWRDAGAEARTGVCLEMLCRLGQSLPLFLNAHATVHTAGQSFMMAFAGCGANALDRGLEALAYAWKAQRDVPAGARWSRGFGGGQSVTLEKQFRLMPRGVGVVITCATFPQWNGYPAVMANLATGNPCVIKPHPNCILPVALFVRSMRQVLAEQGFDANLVTLVADTAEDPATKRLLQHRDTALIDFTGGPDFGHWIETHCTHAQVYTETAGCNSVIIESTDNLDALCQALAHSLCQASAQMCTSVQNLFVPKAGIRTDKGHKSLEQVAAALVLAVDELLEDPARAALVCGALVSEAVVSRLTRLRDSVGAAGRVLRESTPYQHPEYPAARTATPLMLAVDAADQALYGQEHFGPVSFLIACDDADHGLRLATEDVRRHGAITAHVYSCDPAFVERAVDAYHDAGASVSCNLVGMPINFAAAYSDYHVTGLNPAGNACLTDLAFVTRRFRIVQNRWPVTDDQG